VVPQDGRMNRRLALVALTLSGLLWGTSAALTKIALGAVEPGWLTAARFVLAGLPLLWVARNRLRAALTWPIVIWGALGYGVVVELWNLGLVRTSVTHGALLVAAVPGMVAVIALLAGRGSAGARAWLGYALALVGVGLVVAGGGGQASLPGDLCVAASMLLSSGFTVAQSDLLAGRDPLAVTAVQFAAAAVVTVVYAIGTEGLPLAATQVVPTSGLAAVVALVVTATLLPFTLFAWAQARTTPEIAGAFLNLEPLVGTASGAAVFGDPFGLSQCVGAAAVLGGIALSALPARASHPAPDPAPVVAEAAELEGLEDLDGEPRESTLVPA
jgi:O-acetylserine/cysteine efflux transporter